MKKAPYFFVLLTSLLLNACSEESAITDNVNNEDNTPALRYGGDGKFDLLGHGCDVTNSFLIGKARVVDNDKLSQEMPFVINPDKSQLKSEKIISGSTAENYLRTITKTKSASLGAFALAKAEVTNTFTSTSTYSTNFSFANIEKYIQKASYTYVFDAGFFRDNGYLSPEFQYAVTKFTPDQIIKTFGTHVYGNVKLGGKISVMYKADISTASIEKIKSTEAGASAAFKKLFNVDVKYSSTERESAEKETKESALYISTIGGDASIPITNQVISDWKAITTMSTAEWERSVTNGINCSLIDIDANSLIPIWEFLAPGEARNALKAAVDKYISDNKFTDIKVPERPVRPSVLYGGQFLSKGQYIESANQRYRLTFQSDGNVVITDQNKGSSSGLWGMNRGVYSDNNQFIMQDDGNLCMYNQRGKCNWDSNTEKIARGGKAVLENTGRMIVYDGGGAIKWMDGVKF